MMAILVFIFLGMIAWIIYEAVTAPVVDDWHDECVKARENKPKN